MQTLNSIAIMKKKPSYRFLICIESAISINLLRQELTQNCDYTTNQTVYFTFQCLIWIRTIKTEN